MRLIDDPKNQTPSYHVISGDGRSDIRVLRGFCDKYNGYDITLYFPKHPVGKQTGLKALKVYKER
ncbi:MAG: hypothetical protein ACTSRW_05730 [Candidatus Helarchaeota archaeon]